MKKQKLITAIILASALISCDNPDISPPDTVAGLNTTSNNKYIASTPNVLRNIPLEDLSAEITIGNTTYTHRGAEADDGSWQVQVDLLPNQTHDITIKWFALTHLVLEESGQFFADTISPNITPELNFTSAGYPRFDDDCDGTSNLEEIRRNTDPATGEASMQSDCPFSTPQIELRDVESPWVIKQHKLFRSNGFTPRITKFEQPMQIRSINPAMQSAYYSTISTQGTAEAAATIARIDFLYHPEKEKRIRFSVNFATDAETQEIEGAICGPSSASSTFYACTIPYEWQEQQWYNVQFEEISPGRWRGVVVENLTELSQLIGIINTASDIDWYRPQNGITYQQAVPAQDCRQGLMPISMRYTTGVANDEQILESSQIVSSDCVKAGAGWSEGLRTVDDRLMYSLTLGKIE